MFNLLAELDLYAVKDLKEAFYKAQILKRGDTWQEQSSYLLKLWANEWHQYHPMTHAKWHRMLRKAEEVITNFCQGKDLYSSQLPHALVKDMLEEASKKEKEAIRKVRNQLIDVLDAQGLIPSGPDGLDIQKMRDGEPQERHWVPTITRQPGQSDESFEEQQKALALVVNSIDQYLSGTTAHVLWPLLIGVPGAGKTYIVLLGVVYALSKCLNVIITSLTGKRSQTLGGMHMHDLFCIRESPGARTISALRMAQNCLINLQRQPEKKAILRHADIIVIEEISMFSREQFATMFEVMCRLMEVDSPFGGKLLIGTGDPRQLQPINGAPFWMTHCLYADFIPAVLRHYVRCAEDRQLQELNNLLHKVHLSSQEIEQVLTIINENVPDCNYYKRWADIPSSIACIVPRKTSVEEINNQCVKRRRETVAQYNRSRSPSDQKQEYDSIAIDYVETTSGGEYSDKPDEYTRRILDANVHERRELYLSQGGIYNFTYNDRRRPPRFTQGQTCILEKIIFPKGK